MKKIVFPIDGSHYSKKALRYAEDMNLLIGSEIHLITVVQMGYAAKNTGGEVNFYPEHVVHPREDAENHLRDAKALFESMNIEVKSSILMGDPAQMIIKYADEIAADLIVIGNRGLGAISRAFLGSVSHKVLHQARRSVLIVKG